MNTKSDFAPLLALHDQHLEKGKEWWRSADEHFKAKVLERINWYLDCDDPVDEIVSRFAIIGLIIIYELIEQEDNQHE